MPNDRGDGGVRWKPGTLHLCKAYIWCQCAMDGTRSATAGGRHRRSLLPRSAHAHILLPLAAAGRPGKPLVFAPPSIAFLLTSGVRITLTEHSGGDLLESKFASHCGLSQAQLARLGLYPKESLAQPYPPDILGPSMHPPFWRGDWMQSLFALFFS
jgi:hypothetical protein